MFRFEYDDGLLPPHLRLHGLATSIHQNTQACLTGIANPCVHLITDNLSQIQGLPSSFRISRGDHSHCDNKPGPPSEGRFRNNRGGSGVGYVGKSGHGDGGCPRDGRSLCEHRRPVGLGWLARLDRNQHPFLEGVQCAACGRAGHIAKQCDMLAMAICLERYMKKELSTSFCDAIKQEWLGKWKDRLGNPSSTLRQVVHTYVEALDITVAGLDEEMDWSCWDCNLDEESK